MKRLRAALVLAIALAGAAPQAQAEDPALLRVNTLRAEVGQTPLMMDPALSRAAARHAADMAQNGFFAHQGSDGSNVGHRTRAAGYAWCFVAENIAKGQRSLAAALDSWSQSAGHYRNMIHPDARHMGLARGANYHWVMVLAAPC